MRLAVLAATAAAGLVSTAAWAEDLPVLNEAYCQRRPTLEQEQAARRKAGVMEGTRGEVRLRCTASDGPLRDCRVTSETPQGDHFADAALLLADKYSCRTYYSKFKTLPIEFTYVFNRLSPDSRDMVRWPDEDDFRLTIPEQAVRNHIGGSAILQCEVTAEGLLDKCEVAAEAPANMGFGSAALLVAPGIRMARPLRHGVLIADSTVRLGIWYPSLPTGFYEKGDLERVAPFVYWAEVPTRAELQAAFPAEAKDNATYGRVLFRCGFASDGRLGKCDLLDVASDSSANFSTAARSLLPKFRMEVGSIDPALLPKIKTNLVIWFRAHASAPAVEHPEWTRTVRQDNLQQVFPDKAADAGLVTGRASLDCIADAHGMMTGCKVLDEDPAGMDFGAAAVRAAAFMGVNPWTNDGEPVEGAHVKFAIRLNRAEPAPGAASQASPKPQ